MALSSASFDAIVRDTFYQLLQIHPEYAIGLGYPYEGMLPDLSLDSISREKGLIMLTLEKLRDVDIDSLPFQKKLDLMAFRDYLRLRWFFLDRWPIWRMYPEAPEILYNIMLYTYLDPDLDFPTKVRKIISYLKETPTFLERSKARIKQPVRIFVDVSLLMITSLKHFLYILLDEISRDRQASRIYTSNKRDFDNGLEAVDKYMEWIQSLREREIYENIMGRELYDELIKIRRLYNSLDEVYRMLKRGIEEWRKKLDVLAQEVKADATPHDILKIIYEKTPSSQLSAVSLYERSLVDVRRVIMEKKPLNLEDIPVEISLLPAPATLRLPIFHYYPKISRDKGVEKAVIYVKISEETEELQLHNPYFVLHRIMREIFPGKHLMFVSAMASGNRVRQMLDLPELMEGWALYADHVMAEYGYTNNPMHNFIRGVEVYRSILLAYVDVAVNIGDLSYTQATKLLMERGFMSKNEATSSVIQVLLSPTSGLSAYIGFRFLNDLRKRMEGLTSRELDLRWFHNTILKNAVLPLPYLEIALVREYSEYLIEKIMEKISRERELGI